ncbi:PTS ascorbate transporter subunit IIC [Neobacillus notoginsengisoli]|uniref:Ascorbate-specific PTS system EIIC component n=1 Tax=Neobacillus notoginsengisoli TaxID=1578198 RepID=A0A417YIK8_9BACI|nr:PTS ascorbate transporter subunit IIC [Neobacillus notoginsengisoli]RHW32853.1 PTS ascorbate transporter subunit IIC [Neobacillus notoginsengisoli]
MNFQLINKGLLGEPAILLGMIALLGLVLQRHKPQKVLSGTVKAMLGYTLLQIGATAAGSSLSNLSVIILNGFQIIGIIPHNETVTALAQSYYGRDIAFIMLIGMIGHLAIARFTKCKYIFLTGHHILFMASLLAVVLASYSLLPWHIYIIGGLVLAMCMSIGPAVVQPYVRHVTGNDEFAIGHFNSAGYVLAGLIASIFKTKKNPTIPDKLNRVQPYFQDQIVVTAIFTFILFLSASMFASPQQLTELFQGRHFIVVSAIQAIWFAGGVYIILHGVRMMLAEIIPAFNGIAQRVVPGSIPAMDCPVLFAFAPLASVLGFLLSFLGGILAMVLLVGIQYTVIIPGIIPHIFSGGAAGVIAYKVGGRMGLIVSSLCHGFFITLLPLFLTPALSDLGSVRATFADSDFSLIGIFIHEIVQLLF